MLLNPRYGLIGLISFPYWILFEWFAPLIQLAGIFYFAFLATYGFLNLELCFSLTLFVIAFSGMYSIFAIFFEAYTYNKYHGVRYLSQSILFSLFEMIIYQPLNMYFSVCGNFDYVFRKNKTKWGEMTRKGFSKKKNR